MDEIVFKWSTFNGIPLEWGFKSGIAMALIMIPLRIWWQGSAMKKLVANLDDDEKIIYTMKHSDYFLAFLAGFMLLGYLLPCVVFPHYLERVGYVNKFILVWAIFAGLVCLFCTITSAAAAEIITNKRICRIYNFDVMNKYLKKFNLPLKEIEKVYPLPIYMGFGTRIQILARDKKECALYYYKNLKEVEKYLKEKIERSSDVQ